MMATKEERDLILEMLSSGRITPDEARRLFDAVEYCAVIAAEDECDLPGCDVVNAVKDTLRESIQIANEAIRHAVAWEY
jgi:hypothetical protein